MPKSGLSHAEVACASHVDEIRRSIHVASTKRGLQSVRQLYRTIGTYNVVVRLGGRNLLSSVRFEL